jgi:hypothetical protein
MSLASYDALTIVSGAAQNVIEFTLRCDLLDPMKPSCKSPVSSCLQLATSVLLGACGGAETVVNVGATGVSLAPAPSANNAPQITGVPTVSIAAGTSFTFTPATYDAEGQVLSFSVVNKPSWAAFSISTGRLSGTPGDAHVRSYEGIVIRVSDGFATTDLPAFTLVVNSRPAGSPPSAGTALLSWTAPAQNTNGRELIDLAGFRIYYGERADALTRAQDIANPGTTSFRYEGLSRGTHYFAVSAYNSSGIESAPSGVGSKTIQ